MTSCFAGPFNDQLILVFRCYDYEYHLNNDIALAHIDYFYVTQNLTWLTTKGFPVIREVAEMWPSLVNYNKSTNDFDM